MASRHDIVLNIRAEIKDTQAKLKKLQTGLQQAGGATRQLADVGGSASFAVISMGQGFADAGQFGVGMAQGIRAVTNNAQQMVGAIVHLNLMTGSATAAFRAMWTAMLGPVGILVAFSAVSAALEFFSNRAQMATSKAKGLKDEIGKLAASILEFTGGETGKLQGDISIIEGISVQIGRQVGFYDRLVQSRKDLKALDKTSNNAAENLLFKEEKRFNIKQEIKMLEGFLHGLTAEEAEAQRAVLKLANEKMASLKLELAIRKEAKRLGFLDPPDKDKPDDKDASEELVEGLVNKNRDLLIVLEALKGPQGELVALLQDENKELERLIRWQGFLNRLSEEQLEHLDDITPMRALQVKQIEHEIEAVVRLANAYRTSSAEYSAYIRQRNAALAEDAHIMEVQQQLITDLIVSLSTIGGGYDAFLSTLGSFLSRYGAEMIKFGVTSMALGATAEAVKAALKTFSGVPAIIAGAALVAAGSALKAQGSRSVKRLSGGGSGGFIPTAPGTSLTPDFVNGAGGSFGFGATRNVVAPAMANNFRFRISGRDLIAVQEEEIGARTRMLGQ